MCPRRGWCPGRDVCDPRRSFEAARGEAQLRREPWAMRGSRSWAWLLVFVPLLRACEMRPTYRCQHVRRDPVREAERAGFEPATHLSARTRFPVALLRPLGHLSVLRSGEGGIRTLDGGIHPHNALAGRRLQPLGHFSAGPRRIADPDLRIPLRGEESTPDSTKMSLPAPPSYPRQSETRLRLPEAGFAFQGDYDTLIVSFIPAASWPGIVQ